MTSRFRTSLAQLLPGKLPIRCGVALTVTGCFLAGAASPPMASAAPRTAVLTRPIHAQWGGTAPFGVGFKNPLSAYVASFSWQDTNAASAIRAPLKAMGYTDAQLATMSTDEMISAVRRDVGPGSAGVVAPAAPPAVPPGPAVLTFAPGVSTTKTQVAKGELAGLVFPATSASKFVPTKKRLATKPLVAALSTDPSTQKTLDEIIEVGLKEYDKEAAVEGLLNDVAGSMAFFIGTCELVSNDGKEPDADGLALLARVLQQHLENPKVKRVSSADKQKMHEFLVGFGSIVLTTYFVSVETNDLATAMR